MSGFARYYLGAPAISKIEVTAYANGRAAWADLLRSKVDMLYEVGPDAIDLTPGSQVALYAFDRPYQYMVLLNPRKKALASPEIRRALNEALDRTALVRDGLRNHGTPSTGPVSSQHWAYSEQRGTFRYAPAQAAAILQKAKLRITCLTPAEAPYDRLALIVKQQLAAVGVDLDVQEATPDQINKVFAARDFEAVLVDFISGWSLYRPYRWWHSNGANNLVYSEPSVDAALDRIHHAVNDQDYKSGVEAFQKAVAASPPALFLAWGQRSRAVARAFEVPAQPGRDVLASLRLWRPPADNRKATNH
jgi:ABC-type transport system substrate-binding protein